MARLKRVGIGTGRSSSASRGSLPGPSSIAAGRTPRLSSLKKPLVVDDSDDEEASLSEISPPLQKRGSFVGVVIPNKSKPAPKSNTSVSSANSPAFTRETSAELDTPATSVSGPKSTRSSVRGKMKRDFVDLTLEEDDMDTTNDALFAQHLQEQEYSASSTSRKRKASFIEHSLAEDSEEPWACIADSSDDDSLLEQNKRRKRGYFLTKITRAEKQKNEREAMGFPVSPDDLSQREDEEFLIPPDADSSDDDEPLTADANGYIGVNRNTGGFRRTLRAQRERRKLEKAHPQILTMWQTLKDIPVIATHKAPQPAAITRRLKDFQLEGLNWMVLQEKTQWRGGLLGDEMGMGKTIQCVSLLASDYPAKQPSLVVVPPVALMQWTNEIKDYTDGKFKTLVYHGSNSRVKNMTVKELKTYDVILISYSSLESVYRKQVKGWTRNNKIVKEDSAIHSIHFHRVVLDEAHSIKSRTTGVAKACFALQSNYKWCLSGTPVQNRIGEFFSLLRFLNVQPFACYFCKQCPCASLHWTVDARYRCVDCGHRSLDHVSVFQQEILSPITSDHEPSRREAFAKLKLLTDRIMLRRLKRDQTASMELPPKEIILRNEFFSEIERDFSTSIMSNTARQFDTYVSRGVMLNNYANIFGLIMQMRQVADHPDLILKKGNSEGQNVLVCNICDEPCEDAIRSRCKHDFCRRCVKDYVQTCEASGATPDCPRCHIVLSIDFDQPEIEQEEDQVKKSSIISKIQMEHWVSSTKIEMLVYELYKLRSKKRTLKSIVFSQFTSMLQLVEWRLRRAGFTTVMLEGSMTPEARNRSVQYFMNTPSCEIFLVSLKAGGVALNLTEASRVFIIDPWWNPAVESQSADRCHRIGQRRPCVITRLVVEDSIESRIVQLQEKKKSMTDIAIDNDEKALSNLSPADMMFLFRSS